MASGSGWNLWVWLAGGECLVGVQAHSQQFAKGGSTRDI